MPEGIKCPHCGLVQYRAGDGLCKRCKMNLDEPPELPPEEEVETTETQEEEPAPRKGFDPAAIPLYVIGAIFLIIAIYVVTHIPGWFAMKGAKVSYFVDATGLIEIDFPAGWRHLGLRKDLKEGNVKIPGYEGKRFLETIRGSFYTGARSNPDALFFSRIESLGIAGAMGFSLTGQTLERASPEMIAEAMHAMWMSQALQMGGTYMVLGSSTEPMSRFNAVRSDGVIELPGTFFSWKGGGSYHVSVFFFRESARMYWFTVVTPENSYQESWLKVQEAFRNMTINTAEL